MKLNQAALARLLESPGWPVGREVARRAEEVVVAARSNARTIMHRLPEDTWAQVAADIDYEQHGTEAMVGVRDGGEITRYLAEKEAREGVILRRALQDVFRGGNT